MNQLLNNEQISAAIRVRSDVRAGRTVCYQLVGDAWVPILDSNTPLPPIPTPSPAPPPGVQMLDCQSCTGSELAPGLLSNARCEVCYL
jgi:hypothetical protein